MTLEQILQDAARTLAGFEHYADGEPGLPDGVMRLRVLVRNVERLRAERDEARAERDKANAEADRLAEELLVARGEVARLRGAAGEFAAARQAHRAAFDQVAPDHVLAAAKARLAAAESALILTLDTPAREGGGA